MSSLEVGLACASFVVHHWDKIREQIKNKIENKVPASLDYSGGSNLELFVGVPEPKFFMGEHPVHLVIFTKKPQTQKIAETGSVSAHAPFATSDYFAVAVRFVPREARAEAVGAVSRKRKGWEHTAETKDNGNLSFYVVSRALSNVSNSPLISSIVLPPEHVASVTITTQEFSLVRALQAYESGRIGKPTLSPQQHSPHQTAEELQRPAVESLQECFAAMLAEAFSQCFTMHAYKNSGGRVVVEFSPPRKPPST